MKYFRGQTYRGRRDNADIREITLRTEPGPGKAYVAFSAVTKPDSEHTDGALRVEGEIYPDVAWAFVSAIQAERGVSRIDVTALEESVWNTYDNLAHPQHVERKGVKRHGRRRRRGSGKQEYVSDKPRHYAKHTVRKRSAAVGEKHGPQPAHIRTGYTREIRGVAYPCLPYVVHSEDFGPEELLSYGFSAEGKPSQEAVRTWAGSLSEADIEYLIEYRKLKPLLEMRRKKS